MNVTKTQLRDFVDVKISARRKELHKEIQETIKRELGEALTPILGNVAELQRIASKFEDLLTAKIHILGADNVPEYSKYVTNEANKLCKAHDYFLGELATDAYYAIVDQKYYKFKCEPLMSKFNELNALLQPQVQLYKKGLDTLKNELNNAITNESTGNRGYNALVALGMDMKDMPEVNPNLPSVTKLSIDVCILNGNCEEKAS